MYDQANPSIKCTVSICAHFKNQACTLNEIQVGCCQSKVDCCQDTKCASFQLGSTNSCH